MKTNTNHIGHRLVFYVHDELDERETTYIATHLEQCAACRGEYELIKKGAEMLASLKSIPAPRNLWDTILRELRSQTESFTEDSEKTHLPKINK